MKYIYTLFLFTLVVWGCQDVKIGCLDVNNAEYMPDTMLVRKELGFITDDWNIIRDDNMRKKVEAPWVTNQIQGVVGTAPIQYSLYDVKASDGGDAEIFKTELKIRGGNHGSPFCSGISQWTLCDFLKSGSRGVYFDH